MNAIGTCDTPGSRVVAPGLMARRWWRLELRRGAAAVGDMLAITNAVYLPAATTADLTRSA
jgi:hypothetical protein